MEWYEKVSLKVMNFIVLHHPNKTPDELDRIKYGIEAFLVNLGKTPLFFILAYLLGFLKEFTIMFFLFGSIRTFAGGFHAKTSKGCLYISTIQFTLMLYLSVSTTVPDLIKLPVFLCCFILFAKYAPADNEEKPIVNKKHRHFLRLMTLAVTGILVLVSYFTKDSLISNIIFICVVFECFSVTPILYKLFNRRWRNYEYFLSSYSKDC